jgi:tRNA nucleotidyltransferase/poly(A) polymerase
VSAPTIDDHAAERIPDHVVGVARRLSEGGFEAWLVGEPVHALLSSPMPTAFELSTTASPEACLDLFPNAVPTQGNRGIVTVPPGPASEPRCPVDLVSRRSGGTVESNLSHRDFTIFALAWSPETGELRDPHGGARDATAGFLRAVGSPAERLSEDPVRALRACRVVAEHAYRVDPALESALEAIGPRLKTEDAGRKRRELVRILMAPHAEAGLSLLRRTGIEGRLVKYVRDDAAALVQSLPPVLSLRMAAWLRGTRPAGMLRRLRFGIARFGQVERLLSHHPLDQKVLPTVDRQLLKLLRQLEEADIEALFAMREWELERLPSRAQAAGEASAARRELAAVRAGIERVRTNQERSTQREALALDGTTVMQLLACGPGRRVGTALAYLTERVASDPALNAPAVLREELLEWALQNPVRERHRR